MFIRTVERRAGCQVAICMTIDAMYILHVYQVATELKDAVMYILYGYYVPTGQ